MPGCIYGSSDHNEPINHLAYSSFASPCLLAGTPGRVLSFDPDKVCEKRLSGTGAVDAVLLSDLIAMHTEVEYQSPSPSPKNSARGISKALHVLSPRTYYEFLWTIIIKTSRWSSCCRATESKVFIMRGKAALVLVVGLLLLSKARARYSVTEINIHNDPRRIDKKALHRGVEDRFNQIYAGRGWGTAGRGSGPGSSLQATTVTRAILRTVIAKMRLHSMLDAPCGEASLPKHINICISICH